jgi:glutathione S-transferase
MAHVLYGFSGSGNCFKIELLLRQLGLEYRWQEIDITRGESRNADYLVINPNGKVPVLELPGGEFVAESNAAICHLAEGTSFMPVAGLARTRILEWLFFEQYSHEPYIAVLRAVRGLGLYQLDTERQLDFEKKGYRALGILEDRLEKQRFLAGNEYTVADIALFAYTHVAAEGGFDMGRYPAINGWLDAVKATPGFFPMPDRH